MGRANRIDIEDGWYHLMNRGVNRETVFFHDRDRIEFGRLLQVVFERFGVETVAYCLMTNHYHLVVHCPQAHLSEAMHLLGSVYTRHTNDRVGRDGPLFRSRFHAVPIVGDDQLLRTVRYVHRNALDLPSVDEVAGYRWSSHRAYLGLRSLPPFLHIGSVLEHFDGPDGFDAFVRNDLQGMSAEDLAVERIAPIVAIVADEVDAPNVHGSRSARLLQLLVADRLPEPSGQSLRDRLGYSTPKSLQQARARAGLRLDAQPELEAIVGRTLELVA